MIFNSELISVLSFTSENLIIVFLTKHHRFRFRHPLGHYFVPISLFLLETIINFHHLYVYILDHSNNQSLSKSQDSLSLFKILSDKHPSAISNLSIQYRMNRDIMDFSNYLVYNYKMRCIDQSVMNAYLDVKSIDGIFCKTCKISCWMHKTLDPM